MNMNSSGRRADTHRRMVVPACVLLAVSLSPILSCGYTARRYVPPPVAYSGSSSGVHESVIVPTLDTPAPKGKNVVWCGSLQMAWNQLKSDVIKGPVRVAGAQDVADRLNSASFSEDDLPPGSFYAAAGFVPDVVKKIRTEMAEKFPGVKVQMEENPAPGGIIAYGYLKAAAKFTTPYFDRSQGDVFTDSAGRGTRVRTFGLFETKGMAEVNERLAAQIDVLYSTRGDDPVNPKEFILDLCKTSKPNQVILAAVEPKETLAATLDYVRRMSAAGEGGKDKTTFSSEDVLAVPNLHWKIEHHFAELEGKGILNPGFTNLPLVRVFQMIDFKLDRSGAEVASSADIYAAAIPRRYCFTRPFLVIMTRRGAKDPFFVMWVDNAELLSRVS